MRARLARMGSKTQTGNPVLEPLFRTVRANHPKADLALLERAYLTAEKHHGTQMRKSGDPYITHPLAVTTILADIGMTEPTLVAALLHDTVEDTPYTLDQLRADFGDEVAHPRRRGDQARQGQVRRRRAGRDHPQDDRGDGPRHPGAGHQARRPAAQHAHACATSSSPRRSGRPRESLDIYAPLAHRLGMNTIKWELEDLAFATLHPKVYDEIVRMVADRAPSRDQFLAEVINQVEADLKEAKVKATVTGRPKHYYSIYQKMILGGREFSDIYDLVGIRVLVEEDRDCYSVLGVLHSRWNPVLGPVQGLRRDAEVQHVPVAAHDGDRPAGQAGRDPDPHLRHAPPRGVRRRGALEVQGGRPQRRRHRPARRPRRHVVGAPAARLAERGRGPGRVPGVAALRDQPGRGLRLHPARRRDRAAHRARRRSTSRTPCTPRSATTPSAPGSTAGWCRWSRRSRTPTWSRSSPPRRRTPARRGTGSAS